MISVIKREEGLAKINAKENNVNIDIIVVDLVWYNMDSCKDMGNGIYWWSKCGLHMNVNDVYQKLNTT